MTVPFRTGSKIQGLGKNDIMFLCSLWADRNRAIAGRPDHCHRCRRRVFRSETQIIPPPKWGRLIPTCMDCAMVLDPELRERIESGKFQKEVREKVDQHVAEVKEREENPYRE